MKKTKQTAKFSRGIVGNIRVIPKARLLFILLFATVGSFLLFKTFAATGQIYLVTSTASAQVNEEVNVNIRINPGAPIYGVEDVILTYDSTKLEYVSVDTTGSPFEADLGQTIVSGSIEVNRATFGASIETDSLIAVVKFKALTGSGTTDVRVTGNAAGDGGYTNPIGSSSTITFTSPSVSNGVITGVVTDSAGTPIAGATVGLTVNGAKRSMKTSSSGSYTVSNMPSGTYTVKYSARKYQTQTISVSVTAGSVTTQNVTLQQR